MPATWPSGVPYKLILSTGRRIAPETGVRSPTDSGLARQRQQFTAVQKGFAGTIRMTQTQLTDFEAWYDALAGGTFTHPKHPFTGATAEARWIVGQMGEATPDTRAVGCWLKPVAFEFL